MWVEFADFIPHNGAYIKKKIMITKACLMAETVKPEKGTKL